MGALQFCRDKFVFKAKMKNAVILSYYEAFQQDLGQIYPKNQIFTMARTRKGDFLDYLKYLTAESNIFIS